jgi:hypothetical protein
LEARQFRIFGFEDGVYLRSLESRFEILQSNFITHFAYNPWLGDLRVDELTTGEGTYAHSLISLFSHLGIVGGLLFALYLVAIFREARRPSPSALPFYGSPDLGLFKLVIMAGVIGFACIATFFRWLPLWACLGFFYGPFVLRQPQVLRVRYEARDRRTVGPASA